jgi:hypothetical protein
MCNRFENLTVVMKVVKVVNDNFVVCVHHSVPKCKYHLFSWQLKLQM